ncbi:MAG: hypothetical protein LV481_15185 [Methylacidiphilales bacterium]|nr:hypothetical protein [Candidatus Methylacidiphilales bacterium]
MSIPKNLKAKLLARFDELIAAGEHILQNPEEVPAVFARDSMTGIPYVQEPPSQRLNWSKLVEWRTKSATLLSQVLPKSSIHGNAPEQFLDVTAQTIETGLSTLRAVKDDFENGYLDDLFSQIEAEIASDYMGQAEELLAEGGSGKYDHVPAAVLAGAILEKGLRKICDLQTPPILTKKSDGKPKTLDPLIDDLKKAGIFNDLKAKQLKAWAAIRNKAAHGEFDQFNKTEVKAMIEGISGFLADYLG